MTTPPDHDADDIDHESVTLKCALSRLTAPIEVGEIGHGLAGSSAFFKWPLGPLLFLNESSDARDHCANERTFLSYLKLSIYMAILSVAMSLSFHIQGQPTALERRISKPLGAVFWALSVLSLGVGCANYIRTVNMYSRKAAIVQSGWRTQLIMGVISVSIIGTCVVLLIISRKGSTED